MNDPTARQIYDAIKRQRDHRLAQADKSNTGGVCYGMEIALSTILALTDPEMCMTQQGRLRALFDEMGVIYTVTEDDTDTVTIPVGQSDEIHFDFDNRGRFVYVTVYQA